MEEEDPMCYEENQESLQPQKTIEESVLWKKG